MNRTASLVLLASLLAAAVEVRPNLGGDFSKVSKDGAGHLVPAGWMLNSAFKANGTWGAVPDAERGGHALGVAAERGQIHVFTSKGFAAGPGTDVSISLEVRGTGSFKVWLYCYGESGGWVGENVEGPVVKITKPGWQKQTFPLPIPDKPFPKGTVTQIKPAFEVDKGSTLEFDNVVMTMEIEMEPTKTAPAGQNLRLLLPPVIHATPGLESNIYLDNTILAINPANYAFDVTCGKGAQQAERWTFTPKAEDVGGYPLTLAIRDDSNAVIASATTLVRVMPSKAEASLSVLMIGDSLTHASLYPAQVVANAAADEKLSVILVGSHQPKGKDSPVRHEGYGGWTAKAFIAKWDENPDPGRKANSPFLYKDGDAAPTLDFPRYCREYNNGKAPDAVTILLGCNDVFGCSDDTIAEKAADSLENFGKIIELVHAFGPKTQIGILLPVPPAATQDAFAVNYGCGQTRWQYLRNQHYMLEQLTKTYANREAEGIHLLAAFTALDTIRGFPTKTAPANSRSEVKISRLNNGVHPSASGYQQIGDVISAWLVSLANRE